MTIWEFAKKAHVSIATVSRAMNPETRHKVSAETLKRLEALAKKHGYTPNLAAKHLRGGAFKTIGVLMPHLSGIFYSNYYAKILSGVADALLDTEYRFKAILLKPEPHWDKYNFKMGESIDGLIVTHWPNFFSEASVLDKLNVPCAVINDPEKGVKVRFAGGDNEEGGKIAAQHLLKMGHRRAAVLAGEEWSSDSNLRVAGFRAAFERGGGRLEVLPGNFQESTAGVLAADLWKKKSGVTALFCCNDLMACGAAKALAGIGVQCPRDVSIVGYDDDDRARTNDPPLTTVRVPLHSLAKQVTSELIMYLKKTGKKNPFSGEMTFPVELVERSSVGKI